MSQPIRYVGLNVCKETIAIAVPEPDGSVVKYGDIANNPGAIRRLLETLSRDALVKTAYEAGPTGYPLHRQLTALGVENMVVAPSLIPRPARGSGQDGSARCDPAGAAAGPRGNRVTSLTRWAMANRPAWRTPGFGDFRVSLTAPGAAPRWTCQAAVRALNPGLACWHEPEGRPC
jgi:hypothetical protein